MSNHTDESKGHIDFGDNHTRITPRSMVELLELDVSDIHLLILKIYDNKALLVQFRPNFSRYIRKVSSYPVGSFVPDDVLHNWIHVLKTLIPKEDGWELQQSRKIQSRGQRTRELENTLHDHPSFEFFYDSMVAIGKCFSWETATEVDIREGIRWCNLHRRIVTGKYYEEFREKIDLDNQYMDTYLQLYEISIALGEYSRCAEMVERIELYPSSEAFLAHHSEYQLAQGEKLIDLSLERLQEIYRELKAMSRTGMEYDSSGAFVSKS